MDMKSALIVGVGAGLSASLARLFARNGLQVALASRNPDRLAALAHETAATTFACEATEPEEVGGLFDAVIATQGVPDVVVYNASARARGPVAELDPEAVARATGGQRLCRVPGRPAGGASHAAARVRCDPVHRCIGQREGLPAVGAVRDGQVRIARPGAEHGARTVAAGHPRGAFRHRRRHPQRHTSRSRATSRTACWIRMRSPKATGTWRSRRAVRGPGKSNCGHGWNGSNLSCDEYGSG